MVKVRCAWCDETWDEKAKNYRWFCSDKCKNEYNKHVRQFKIAHSEPPRNCCECGTPGANPNGYCDNCNKVSF